MIFTHKKSSNLYPFSTKNSIFISGFDLNSPLLHCVRSNFDRRFLKNFYQMVSISATMAVPKCMNSDSCTLTNTKSNQLSQVPRNKRDHQMGLGLGPGPIPSPGPGPSCCETKVAVMDFLILIAVVTAVGFLLFPSVQFLYVQSVEFSSLVYCILEDEIGENPVVYGFLGISMVLVTAAACGIVMWTTRKCGNKNCRGLWKAAAEFDIRIETEESVRNSTSVDVVGKDLFELPRDRHRELEAELKKIAPPNGRAVLVFRARCGCSVGRMEVPGPKRVARKIKK